MSIYENQSSSPSQASQLKITQILDSEYSPKPPLQIRMEDSSFDSIDFQKPKNIRSSRKNTIVLFSIIFLVIIGGIVVYIQSTFNEKVTILKGKHNNQVVQLQNELKKKESKQLELEKKIKRYQQNPQKLLKNQNKQGQKQQLKQPIKKEFKQNVIDIQYKSSANSVLPINPLKLQDGKNIAYFLYKDEATIKQRDYFVQKKINYIHSSQQTPLFLAKYNIYTNEAMLKEGIAENEKDWLRLQNKFQLSSLKVEMPMCIIVPSFNNNANFRIEANLNSIFTQNYSNYKAIIINDASTDKGNETYRKYFEFYQIDKSKYVYIQNAVRVTALQNIYESIMNECSLDSAMMMLDGDDQFIGRNVLKVFNWGFQTKKAGVVYSNFYWYQQQVRITMGFTSQYTFEEKSNNLYRDIKLKYSHLRGCRTMIFRQINPTDLKDEKGAYFTMTYDQAIFFPAMELSCGRVEKIPGEIHYLYNIGTGNNDYFINQKKQASLQQKIRKQKKYSCFKQFNQTMSK